MRCNGADDEAGIPDGTPDASAGPADTLSAGGIANPLLSGKVGRISIR